MKIRSKFMVSMLFSAILPILIFGIVAHQRTKSYLEDQAIKQLSLFANSQENRINDFIYQSLERVKLVASRTQLRISLNKYLREKDSASLVKMSKILLDAKKSIPDFNEIIIVDRAGYEIVSTNSSRQKKMSIPSDLLKKGLEEYTLDIGKDNNDKRPVCILAGPLQLEGKVIGVVVVKFTPSRLIEIVNNYDYIGETGETIIAKRDKNGNALFLTPIRFDKEAPLKRVVRKSQVRVPITSALNKKETALINSIDYRGIPVLAFTRYLPKVDWGLVVKMNKTEAFSQIDDYNSFFGLVFLFILILLFYITHVLSQVIAKPILDVEKVTKKIIAGNYQERAPIKSQDEIGNMASSFNEMADELFRFNQHLEKQVNIRTSELNQTRKFLESIIENIPNMIFLKDAKNLRFVLFNKAGEKLLGFSRADLIGKNDYDFFPKDQADYFIGKDRKVLEEKKLKDIPEEPIDTKDNGRRLLHTKKLPLLDNNGEPEFLLGISEDITDLKKTEKKLIDLNKELLRSNKDLQNFAYVASHDLQEPLRMVSSYTQLLEKRYKGKLDKDADEFIFYAVDGAKRMQALIQDLLNYSRVSTKAKNFELVSASDSLLRAINNLSMRIQETQATITYDELPKVMADTIQVTQVFQNLIGNALKFYREVKPTVHISVNDRGNEWVFSVKDNGIGIDKQYNKRIFEVFQRLHTREKYTGSGIGLAICKRIINRHNGDIWVESEPGKGTTFFFTISKVQNEGGDYE